MIDKFDGKYAFLSNFHETNFVWQGRRYPTVEHFFQAWKAKTKEDFDFVMSTATPGAAKRAGKKIQLREDWEEVKENIMLEALRTKFSIKGLKEKLLATGDEELVEGNFWHDNFWGVCSCSKCGNKGQNKLGKLLMQVREEKRK